MKKLTFILSITLTLCANAQVPSYVPTNGLVGWWPFNGNANDESGNGNNGTVNGATLTADRFGNSNSAFDFDGIDDVILLPSSSTNYSISFWFNFSILTSQFSDLYYYEDGSVSIVQNGNYMYVRKQNQTIPSIDISTAPILNSQWNHCVIIYDSNLNTLQCIINNSELYNSNFAIGGAPNFINDNQFQIGGRQFNNTNYYNGQIDDIGIWNRALTQEEITALYNGCSDLITAQPSAQTVTLSESNAAQFTVNSPATNPGYQWQTNLGLGFQNLSDAGQYSGSATNILTVNNLSISNNNQQFRCIVSEGTCADTTDAAALTIIDDLGFENLNMSGTKKLVKITDLNGKETPFKKNNVLLFIYEDGTVERVYEAE